MIKEGLRLFIQFYGGEPFKSKNSIIGIRKKILLVC